MNISVAIPDSSLIDESDLLGKTLKISQIARACAIFQVNTIYIYQEAGGFARDKSLLKTILRYIETPQYLRRMLYDKTNELKFAGSLSPLKIPSHMQTSDSNKVKTGDIREGIVAFAKGGKYVDVGLKQLIPYYGESDAGKRIIVQFKEGFPKLSIKQIQKDAIPHYWGYDVKETANLNLLLSSWKSHIIFTSRKGKITHKSQKYFDEISNTNVLLVFGSPKRGVHEILGKNLNNFAKSYTMNFFPDQATETVRLEEAILGTLSILNVLVRK